MYGFDVDGIEIDRAAYDAYQTFFVTWAQRTSASSKVHTMPLRRETKVVGRRLEIVFARDKDEYKGDDVQRVRLVNDDTTQAGEHYRKPDLRRPSSPTCPTAGAAREPGTRDRAHPPAETCSTKRSGLDRRMKPGAAMVCRGTRRC